MKVNELKIGQFAERNGSVIYRYKNPTGKWYSWDDGLFMVQQSPEFPIWEDTPKDSIDRAMVASPNYEYNGQSIFYTETPQKKHVDNTIKLLKDSLKDKKIDNLTYIENLNILRNYLKPVIVSEEK